MTINILYLYYNLMNLYGESGNVKAIEQSLKQQDVEVIVDKLSIEDEIDFSKYDLVYMGTGTENSQLIALEHILKYKQDIMEYIDNDKFILATGNSLEFFGKKIENTNALGILDFETKYLEKRKVGDYIKNSEFGKILAFENRGSKIINNKNQLFDEETGIQYKNLYGAYLIGPLLVRSPEFNKYFTEKLIRSKDKDFELKELNLELNEKAYEIYFENYYKDKK